MTLTLADPALLLLAAGAAGVLLAWYRGRGPARGIVVPSSGRFADLPRSARTRMRPLLLALRCAVVLLLALAAARPQGLSGAVTETNESVDVVLVLDVSSSMASQDFQPDNRLEVAKRVITTFVDNRPGDRIGLVTFARFSTLRCPITIDHEVLKLQLSTAEMASGDDDGTAIGMALASSVNHLRRSPSKSRVVVLLTDGENNRSTIDPATGAAVARALGVSVYTIGVGRLPQELDPADADPGVARAAFNEDALREIAEATGGRYFRATEVAALGEVFSEIDALEKSPVTTPTYARTVEWFWVAALAALALAWLELALRHTLLRRLP